MFLKQKNMHVALTEKEEQKKKKRRNWQIPIMKTFNQYLCLHVSHPGSLGQSPSLFNFMLIVPLKNVFPLKLIPGYLKAPLWDDLLT